MLVHRFIVNIILSPDAGPTTYTVVILSRCYSLTNLAFLLSVEEENIRFTRWLLRSKKATMVNYYMFARNLKTFECSLPIPLSLRSHKGIHPKIWTLSSNPLPSLPVNSHKINLSISVNALATKDFTFHIIIWDESFAGINSVAP